MSLVAQQRAEHRMLLPTFTRPLPFRELQAHSRFRELQIHSRMRTPKIEPHNPRTTPTKAMMNIASAILGVVYMLLFS